MLAGSPRLLCRVKVGLAFINLAALLIELSVEFSELLGLLGERLMFRREGTLLLGMGFLQLCYLALDLCGARTKLSRLLGQPGLAFL